MKSFEEILYKVNPDILIWLGVVETLLQRPINSFMINGWLDAAEEIAETDFEFQEDEWVIIYKLLDKFNLSWHAYFIDQKSTSSTSSAFIQNGMAVPPNNLIEELLARNQTQQRTAEWYEEHRNLLTASEIGDILDSPSAFNALVRSKIIPKESHSQSSAVPSEYMTAFDWGIRFEPVVKQIYEYLYEVTICELGRLYHPTQSRIAASPDGLITKTKNTNFNHLVGNLIEIKCPVSRKPDGKIIPKYYHQIQLQLEVTGLTLCQFAEFNFISKYKEIWEGSEREKAWVKAVEDGALHGNIYLVEKIEKIRRLFSEDAEGPGSAIANIYNSDDTVLVSEQRITHRYEYGPVNKLSWRPDLDEETEHIVETIPWALGAKTQQGVARDPEWWNKTMPRICDFWKAVEDGRKQYAEGRYPLQSPRRKAPTDSIANQQQFCVIKLN